MVSLGDDDGIMGAIRNAMGNTMGNDMMKEERRLCFGFPKEVET